MFKVMHRALCLVENSQYLLHSGDFLGRGETDVKLVYSVHISEPLLDLPLHPILESVNLESFWKGIDLIQNNDDPVLLFNHLLEYFWH